MAKKKDEQATKVTPERRVKSLLASARLARSNVSEIVGVYRSELKEHIEKHHLHRKAFHAVVAEDRMEPNALAEFYEHQEYYRDVLGLTERAKNAPRLPMGDGPAAGEEEGDTNVKNFPRQTSVAAE